MEKIFFALAATAVGVFSTTFALVFRPRRFVGLVKGEASLGKHQELGAASYFLGSMIFFLLGLYYLATTKISADSWTGKHPFLHFFKKPIAVLTSGHVNSIVMNLLPAIALVIVMAVGLRVALWFLRGGGTFDMAMRACFYTTGVWLSVWGMASFLFGVFGVPEFDQLNRDGIIFYSVVLLGPLAFFRVLFSLTRHSFDVGRWRGLGALPLAAVLWAGISISGYFAGKPFFDVREKAAAAVAANKGIEEREAAMLEVARPAVPSPGRPGEPETLDDEYSTEWPFHVYTNAIGLEMLWCRAGTFTMGGEYEKQHEVELTRGFWLGRFEVTQAQWTEVMQVNPSENQLNPRYPVTDVTWYDAKSFCTRLTEREKAAERLPDGWSYDLPTEAQWEYACRAGETTPFSFGSALDGSQANCNGNQPYPEVSSKGPFLGRTTAVGVYPANPWGFHDMHGNVYEWCLDWYGQYQPGPDDQPVKDPLGPATGDPRVGRGGGWFNYARYCRSVFRFRYSPDLANRGLGFRVALSSKPGPAGPAQPGTANPEQAKGGEEASEAAPTKPERVEGEE